jgi:hypothetical protein
VLLRTALAIGLLLAIAAPAQAAKLRVGIGEQNPAFFADPRWQALDAPDVRFVIAWNAMRVRWQREELAGWLAAARARGARPLITFGHARGRREAYLPTRAQFARQFRALRRAYPDLRSFQAWNEANHGTQPTHRRPARAAAYFDAIKRNCPRCTVAAPSVLDMRNMTSWIQRFRRAADRPVRIWSLHNHIDVNRHRTSGTREFLRTTRRGAVWFTETGGIVNRYVDGRRITRYHRANAAKAIQAVFRLARASRRVKRVYLYHWLPPRERRPRWDSALVDRRGNPRPSLTALRRELRRAR